MPKVSKKFRYAKAFNLNVCLLRFRKTHPVRIYYPACRFSAPGSIPSSCDGSWISTGICCGQIQ